jgi:hypothetical protein
VILADLAIVALVLLFAWVLGGVLLRLGGIAVALAGAVGVAASGNPNGVLVFAVGAALWLAGHWHWALRHGCFKSPLAGLLFGRWAPPMLNPTRSRAEGGVADPLEGTSWVRGSARGEVSRGVDRREADPGEGN